MFRRAWPRSRMNAYKTGSLLCKNQDGIHPSAMRGCTTLIMRAAHQTAVKPERMTDVISDIRGWNSVSEKGTCPHADDGNGGV